MWAHYAGGHTGICIEYSVAFFDLGSSGALPILEVSYSDERPKVTTEELMVIGHKGELDEYTGYDPDQILTKLCLSKSTSWSYEKEWRLMGRFGQDCVGYQRAENLIPEAIYLGLNASDETARKVYDIVCGQFPIFRLLPDERNFSFRYSELS